MSEAGSMTLTAPMELGVGEAIEQEERDSSGKQGRSDENGSEGGQVRSWVSVRDESVESDRREAQLKNGRVGYWRHALPAMNAGEYFVEPLEHNDRVLIYRIAKKHGIRITLRRCADRWLIMRIPDAVKSTEAP